MDTFENQTREKLKELRDRYGIIGVKSDFEAEGAGFDEVLFLKSISSTLGLPLSLKIGGCGALRDIRDAKATGADTIIAPMIETSFALKKFTDSVGAVFDIESPDCPELEINIETFTGMMNFDDIVTAKEFYEISGLIFGRTDMVKSIIATSTDVEGTDIFQYADSMSRKMNFMKRKFTLDGGICAGSFKFIKGLMKSNSIKFSTRKIIFDAQKVAASGNPSECIDKALEFEVFWQKSKGRFYSDNFTEDKGKIKMLQSNVSEKIGE